MNKSVVFICLSSDHTFKIHMTVLHDDVNRRHGLDPIVEQTRIIEYRSRHLTADAVIVEGCRKYFNLVVNAFNAFQMLYPSFSGVLYNLVPDLPEQRYR